MGMFGPPGGGAPTGENDLYTFSGDKISLVYQNNAVTDVLSLYEMLTGMTIIKDSGILDGPPVSLVTPNPVEKAEAVRLIEATLLTNGYSIVIDAGGRSARIRSTRARGATELQFAQGVKFYSDPNLIPEGESIITFYLKLQSLLPEEAATILANHVGLNVYGRITPVVAPPGLLITESASIVRHLISITETLDVAGDAAALVTKFIPLKFADATTVAQIVQATITAQTTERETKGISTIRGQAQPEYQRAPSGGQPGSPPPPPQTPNNSGDRDRDRDRDRGGRNGENSDARLPAPAAQVVADSRLNQVLVVANPEDYTYIASLIQEFDKVVDVEEPYERKLNYAYAVDVLSALADFLQEPSTTGGTQLPGGGTLSAANRPVQASSASLLTGGRNSATQRGGTVVGSSGTGVSDDGAGTSSSGAGNRADQLTAPEADNAPISVLVGKTRIIADPMANSIIVMGSREAIERANMLLDKLDRKPAQVYLATVIGQLTLGDGVNFGIDYFTQFNGRGDSPGFTSSFIAANEGIVTNSNVTDVRDNLLTTPFGPLKGFNIYGQIADTVQGYVSALETTNRFKVLSRPSVFALNNKKATITSGQLIPVPSQTITALGNGNNNGNVTTTVEYRDVVLKLEVVPLINPNGEVTLTIAQVNDTIIGTQRVEPNDIPIIGTEQLITTITVPDGHTVVLGGLISEETKRDTEGIPLVSRIPLLGNLFKENRKNKNRKELIIFLQPKVVDDEGKLRDASLSEDLRTTIGADAAKRFPQKVEPTVIEIDEPAPEKKKGLLPRLFGRKRDAE
jgi:type II secretion system protein D